MFTHIRLPPPPALCAASCARPYTHYQACSCVRMHTPTHTHTGVAFLSAPPCIVYAYTCPLVRTVVVSWSAPPCVVYHNYLHTHLHTHTCTRAYTCRCGIMVGTAMGGMGSFSGAVEAWAQHGGFQKFKIQTLDNPILHPPPRSAHTDRGVKS